MKRYIALLRGINISGKNKIAMPELKTCFEQLGYEDVRTHLNSGNVIFSCQQEDTADMAKQINIKIQDRFRLNIPVFVIPQEKLSVILSKAPDWWGTEDKGIYDNLIFVMPDASAANLAAKIGEPAEELERIFITDNVIFWSFDKEKYSKSNWWKKTASAGIGEMITIRTANTARKISSM